MRNMGLWNRKASHVNALGELMQPCKTAGLTGGVAMTGHTLLGVELGHSSLGLGGVHVTAM